MTRMERLVSFAMALLCALALMVSCQKAPELTITGATNIEIGADGGSASFTFLANRDWRINYSDTWITATPTSGTASDGATTVTVRANANTTYEERSAMVTVSMEGLSRTVSVRQSANQDIIIPTQSYVFDTPEARTVEVKVQSNVDYDVVSSVPWIAYSKTKGLSNSTVVLTIAANDGYTTRTGTVTLSNQSGSMNRQISVSQAGRIAVTSVELDKTELWLRENETETLTATVKPDDATDKKVTWTSSNPQIATVDENGTVTAVYSGSVTITAKAGEKSATCAVTVSSGPKGGVDLGIVMTKPGGTTYKLYWAECNLGANNPWEYGDYYAWGETETKTENRWNNYKWGGASTLTKYCRAGDAKYWAGTGDPDGKTVLDPEDDVAHVRLGKKWRMPTNEEFNALQENCNWEWSIQNGINGYKVTSKINGNSIFLPAAGGKTTVVNAAGTNGNYWSSSLHSEMSWKAHDVGFNTTKHTMNGYDRYYGESIRPVSE